MKNHHFLKMKLPKYNPAHGARRCCLWALAGLALATALHYRNRHIGIVGAAGYSGPTSSQPLALSADDSLLAVANPDNNSVTLFDLKNNNASVEVKVGAEPNGVALLPDGSKAYAANTVDGTVSVIKINRSPLSASVSATLTVGTEPYGIAVTPSGGRVYVTNARSNNVSEINTASDQVFRTINNVGAEPRGIAIDGADDGFELIYITQFLALPVPGKTDGSDDAKAGHVTVLSAASGDGIIADISLNPLADTGFKAAGDALQHIPPPATITTADLKFPTGAYPNLLNNIAVHGHFAYVPNTGSSPNGPVRFDVNVQSLLSVIDTGLRKDAGQTINMQKAVAAQTGTPKRFLTNPWAIAFKHNADQAYVVSGASNIAVKLNVDPTGAATVQTDPTDSTRVLEIPTGSNPRGIVINSTDKTAYVMNYISRDVTVIDLSGSVEKVSATLTSTSRPASGSQADKILAGKELFNTSVGVFDPATAGGPQITGRMSNNGWGSCASCHPFGLSDNVVWIFPSGPKRTVPLHVDFDQTDTSRSTQRALNWNAERDEEEDFELNIRAVSSGQGLIVLSDGVTQDPNVVNLTPVASAGRNQLKIRGFGAWDAIKAYIQFGIRAPIAPKSATPDPDIAAGRQLFISNNCQNCHGGPQWSSGRVRFNPPPDPSLIVGGQLVAELHDVGTFNPNAFNEVRANVNPAPVGAQGYQPPSLLSLFAFPQTFFHNGQAASLNDVMANVTHRSAGNGGVDNLTDPNQRAQLVKFLLSIDASTAPVAPPAPGSVRIENAATFVDSPLASDLFSDAKGNGLATQTITNPPAFGPVIGGSTIQVLDSAGVLRLATVANYVSPAQINFILPAGMAAGNANLTITNGAGATYASTIKIGAVSPGFFADQNGTPFSVVIRVAPDGTQSRNLGFTCGNSGCSPLPIDLSQPGSFFLELYGTGFRHNSSLSAVQCTIGSVNAGTVLFAGAQGQFAGEDQLDMPIPASLQGRGTVPVVCTVDGLNTNSVNINLK